MTTVAMLNARRSTLLLRLVFIFKKRFTGGEEGRRRLVGGKADAMTMLQKEIAEQPSALGRLIESGAGAVIAAAGRIRSFRPEWIMIAARGTSDNAARYAQYLFGVRNGWGVALALPSLYTMYDVSPRLRRALTIGISQSGQSPDVVAVLEEARMQEGLTLAVTNDPSSPLANAAELVIPIDAGIENCVPATKTYTAELLALAMLSLAIIDERTRFGEVMRIPDAVAETLDSCGAALEGAAEFAAARTFVVLGRGFNYCTAFEIALKMKETSYVFAEAYSIADFLHGPVAMLERDIPVVLVAPSGRAADNLPNVLDTLEERGARIVALSDRADILERAELPLLLPRGIPEWLSPIVGIVPGQLWAHALAVARGHDPAAPRGLAKVTLTR
jgi:glutamine---fructose-6-phosphate transaminase (isomerizing)